MICPYCGTHIANGSSVCPACHSTLDLTMSIPKLDGTYCKTCGALVPDGVQACPSCGMPVEHKKSVKKLPSLPPDTSVDKPVRTQTRNAASDSDVAAPADVASLLADLPSLEQSTPPQPQASHTLQPQDIPSLDDMLEEPDDVDDQSNDQADDSSDCEAEQTHAIPRIASALPANSNNGYAFENLPSVRTVVTAAIASLLLVGCAVLYLTHPWAPQGSSAQNTTQMDTSKAGFPGVKEKLTGQDSDTTPTTQVESGDEQTYKKLVEAYKKLGDLAQKTDENVESFSSIAFGSDSDARAKAADEAKSLSYQTSNLITEIQSLDTTTGTYVTQINHMATLGNYLRNRLDIINKAWKKVLASDNPSSDKSDIMSILRSSQNGSSQEAYKSLFEQNYESWNPES